MNTKHNGNNPKLRIFSFIPQQRRIQPSFMNHTYQTTNQTKTIQTTKQHQRVFHHQHKACALTTEKTQILEYSYSHFNQFQKVHIQPIWYISSITNLVKNRIRKPWIRSNNYENCLLLHFWFCGLKLLALKSCELKLQNKESFWDSKCFWICFLYFCYCKCRRKV